MRRLRPQEKKGVGEFRLLWLGRYHYATRQEAIEAMAEINVARLKKYVRRLELRLLRTDLALRQIKIKTRRLRRAARAAGREW